MDKTDRLCRPCCETAGLRPIGVGSWKRYHYPSDHRCANKTNLTPECIGCGRHLRPKALIKRGTDSTEVHKIMFEYLNRLAPTDE